MSQPDAAAHVRLDRHPHHTSAVAATLTGTLTGTSPTAARALLSVHGFRPTGQHSLVLARIDDEEPHYAQQAAQDLRAAGLTVDITPALQEDIDTEWTWANQPLHGLDRNEIREISIQAQKIHDDIVAGRLIIHLHAHDGWTTVAVGTYRDGHSVHLHGEDHLRQIARIYTSPTKAISDFEHRYGAAVRNGPAPATDAEQAAAQVLTPTREPQAETAALQPTSPTVPVYAADAGDHEALLADFLDTHHDWEKYRTWCDNTTVASHESLTRRAQFTHEAAPKDTAWAFAVYDSPVGDRLWHATATARTPAALVRTLLDTLASPDAHRPGPKSNGPGHARATGPEPALAQAASALLEAGWQRTSYTWGIQWTPPNGAGAGLRFDARTTRTADSRPGWTAWAGTSIDRPTWRFRLSLHTPATVLEELAHELGHGQVTRRLPSTDAPQRTHHTAPAPALPPQPPQPAPPGHAKRRFTSQRSEGQTGQTDRDLASTAWPGSPGRRFVSRPEQRNV
ncbi:DUF317 domain-containing protein [Streptomyces chrestomyceticus]|uniref:DUF317 domain-containing protein n=1 Tax=Streptomyces chrestomyceticus TaxID=68185 RepID=UPI0037AEFCD1